MNSTIELFYARYRYARYWYVSLVAVIGRMVLAVCNYEPQKPSPKCSLYSSSTSPAPNRTNSVNSSILK